MKYIAILTTFLLISCGPPSFKPEDQLSAEQRSVLIDSLVRYVGKRPENVPVTERFSPNMATHFQEVASRARLEFLKVSGEQYYIAISQPAPSLVEKRTITGIRMKWDGKSNIAAYEEVFRTWKMVPDTLVKHSLPLFVRMMEGKPMDPSQAKGFDKKALQDVEFPDKYTYYDTRSRTWQLRAN